MKDAEARIRTTKAEVQEENRRLGDLDGGNNARRLAEIEEKKSDVALAKERLQQHESSIGDLDEDRRSAEHVYTHSQAPIARKQVELQDQEQRLNGLLRDRGQQQGAYPANMPRLLQAIEEDGGFRQAPVGPVGKHVRLLNPIWSSVLEKSFGGVLNSFIVTSKEDQNRLSNLMQQNRWCVSNSPGVPHCSLITFSPCPIIIGNNTSISITNHEPDPELETTLRALNVSTEPPQHPRV